MMSKKFCRRALIMIPHLLLHVHFKTTIFIDFSLDFFNELHNTFLFDAKYHLINHNKLD